MFLGKKKRLQDTDKSCPYLLPLMAAPEIDVNAALLASVTATGAEAQEAESRWSSTSSAEADESELELDNFWVSNTLPLYQTIRDKCLLSFV